MIIPDLIVICEWESLVVICNCQQLRGYLLLLSSLYAWTQSISIIDKGKRSTRTDTTFALSLDASFRLSLSTIAQRRLSCAYADEHHWPGRRISRLAYAPSYPACQLGWILIIALTADDPFHHRLRVIFRYLKMADFTAVAEDPHMRKAENAECGIGGHAEKVERRFEQKVIIIGAGQYSERCRMTRQV